jgi:hypothetical protein
MDSNADGDQQHRDDTAPALHGIASDTICGV